ncbi:MAG TPA: hypothetical protein VHK88_02550 [Aquihabitans sp.]|nr:hypothetical protein [Aquihabitans sp.]
MEAAVFFIWLVTASGGVALLWTWWRGGGRQEDHPHGHPLGRRVGITSGLAAPHAVFVVTGMVLWGVAAVVDERYSDNMLRWLALAFLVVGVGVGLTMFTKWRGARRSGPDEAVPAAMVYGHGLLAAVTTIGAVVVALVA